MPPLVLLADDDRALRKLLRTYLAAEDIAVAEAGNGPDTLTAIVDRRPDLVVLDVRMPGYDGFEVLRRVDAAGVFSETITMSIWSSRCVSAATRPMVSSSRAKPDSARRAISARWSMQARIYVGSQAPAPRRPGPFGSDNPASVRAISSGCGFTPVH